MPKKLKCFLDGEVTCLELTGDIKNMESPEGARIYFPGGDVSVTRTQDNEYWVHVWVAKHDNNKNDTSAHEGPFASIVGARIDSTEKATHEANVGDLGNDDVYHVAVKIGVES